MTSRFFRVLVCFVRQWLHDHASSTEAEDFTRFQREGGLGPLSPGIRQSLVRVLVSPDEYSSWFLWEMTSRMFPSFRIYLVRQWIHARVSQGCCGMAGFAGYDAPRAVLFDSGRCKAGFVSAVFPLVSTGPSVRSHRCSSWTSLACELFSETGTLSAVCLQTVEIPQLPFFAMLLTCPLLCMSGRRHHRPGAAAWSSELTQCFPCCSH